MKVTWIYFVASLMSSNSIVVFLFLELRLNYLHNLLLAEMEIWEWVSWVLGLLSDVKSLK